MERDVRNQWTENNIENGYYSIIMGQLCCNRMIKDPKVDLHCEVIFLWNMKNENEIKTNKYIDSHLGDAGVIKLSESLENNTVLTKLNLECGNDRAKKKRNRILLLIPLIIE